ncbi:MAG: putative replicase [Circoviridae sp.]|nr:MAG: putative replicase [Circoviridae sp.]
MTLSEFFTKIPNNIPSPEIESLPLAKLSKTIEKSDDIDLFTDLYTNFPAYSMELTISPKSSPRVLQDECATCGRKSLRDLSQQVDIMNTLLEELINKFNINLLGVIENYKDNKNIHSHNIITPLPEKVRPKLRKYIKQFYNLNNNIIINLKPITQPHKYMQYMMKDLLDNEHYNYHYYNQNKSYSLEKIESEKYNYPKHQMDEFQEHSITCTRKQCQICDWISMLERLGMENNQLDEE